MQVRRADKNDVAAVARMWHAGWHVGHAAVVDDALVRLRVPEEFVVRTQSHLEETYVAVIRDEIAGFFMIKEDEVYQFYVDVSRHGSGLAREFMAHAERVLAGHMAHLACSVGNDRAAAFYRKCGWTHVRTGPYEVETSEGVFVVQELRFEKAL